MKIIFTSITFILLSASVHAQQAEFDLSKMKTYYIVFLKKAQAGIRIQ